MNEGESRNISNVEMFLPDYALFLSLSLLLSFSFENICVIVGWEKSMLTEEEIPWEIFLFIC